MPCYINIYHKHQPFSFESLAYHFKQNPIERPLGYPYHHWLQTEKGTGVIYIGDDKIILDEGTGIVIPPFMKHKYYPVTGEWYVNFISFSGYLSNELTHILGDVDYLILNNSPAFSFSDLIKRIVPDGHVDDMTDFEELSSSVYQFIMMIVKYSQENQNMLSPQYNTYIVPVLNMIRNHYHESLTLKMLADQVYISPQYLNRLFKKYLHKSPYQFLKNYRLNRARELFLSSPSMSNDSVCEKVGFSDTSRFIQSFKKETGYTPCQYKKMLLPQTTIYAPTTLSP